MSRPLNLACRMYDEQNIAAARVIVAKGIQGGLRQWAEMVLARLQKQDNSAADVPKAQRNGRAKGETKGRDLLTQGSLFEKGDAA